MNHHKIRINIKKKTWALFVICLLFFFLAGPALLYSEHLPELLTPYEREWLDDHKGMLRVTFDPNFAPIEFVDEYGKFSGFTRDLLTEIEKRIDYTFTVVQFETWNDLIENAKQNNVELIPQIAETPERKTYLSFTKPFLNIPNVIVVNETVTGQLDMSRLKGMRVGVARGYAIHELIELEHPHVNVIPVENEKVGIMMLSINEIDAMIVYISSAAYYIHKMGLSNLRIAGYSGYEFKFSMATQKNMPVLTTILQKGLDSLSKKEIQTIYDKWVTFSPGSFFETRKFWITLLIVFSFISLVIALVLIWNKVLRKQIADRTYELRKTRNDLEAIYNAIQSALIRIDRHGTVLQYNNASIRYMEYDLNPGAVGLPFLYSFPFLAKYKDLYIDAFENQRVMEFLYEVYQNSESLYLNIYFIPVSFENEVGIVIRIDDVSELVLKDQQLRQAQRMEAVGTLAGGIAHDFNNVLGGIVGAMSIIKMKVEDENQGLDRGELGEYLGLVDESAERAKSMIQQLLMFSRKHEAVFSHVDLNTVVNNIGRMCKNIFDRSIDLRITLHPDPVIIKADITQIEQVILNICINAYHAMTIMRPENERHGGKLTLEFEKISADRHFIAIHPEAEAARYWVIDVQDTGVGMDKQTISRIFEPFFTTKSKGEGTGLGLAMVYNIVKEHKGFIDIHSETGKGTSVRIYFPLLDRETAESYRGEDAFPVPKGEGLILVVDDEPVIRDIARSILVECGYTVLCAEDGIDGIEKFKEKQGEIRGILLDLVMPKKTGLEMYKEISQIDPGVRVLLTSGHLEDHRIHQAKREGINNFIQKPYTFTQLARAVHELLEKSVY